MPTFSNSNSTDTMLGLNRVPAKSTLATTEFFSTLPAGISQTALTPMFNPILDSANITSTTTKTIPATASSYGVRVYCQAGSCTVTLNDGTNTPVLVLLAGEAWEMVMHNRLVDKVIITIASSANVNYTVFTAGTCRFTV